LSNLTQWITPAEHFFVRHHLQVPRVNVRTWKLAIEGLVKTRLELAYPELLRRPQTSQTVTLECAGNQSGGGMVGNAQWTGVSLAQLLKEAGLKSGATEVILDGADFGLDEGEYVPTSYSRSLPLEKALAPETLLAFEMNGKVLDTLHGYPLRAVVPGWYGMASVKWLRRIEVTDRPFAGFYMSKRYFTAKRDGVTGEFVISPVREMDIKSQITLPANGETLKPRAYTVQGMAWTGRGKVERVEVSVDGGNSWQMATLFGKRDPWAWVLWKYLWESPEIGERMLSVRAVDNQGRTQPLAEDPERINRYANSWIHRVRVTVVERQVAQASSIRNP
jgi:DMSO/TMAO reductase YedYZ molybdopterin-dependent catalytic subunit